MYLDLMHKPGSLIINKKKNNKSKGFYKLFNLHFGPVYAAEPTPNQALLSFATSLIMLDHETIGTTQLNQQPSASTMQ